MPVTSPLAPERKTDIPVVHGPQTAVVVGEGEIDCDEYGRILVHFHWDLEKAYSMRCRVSQNSASKGWGGMVIPRIGMEVVVEFLEGDPDKPLVTGAVYNGANKVPYELPKHKTRSTFKTDTHKGTGFNELRFEDANGEEEIFVDAEKDMNVGISNDHHRHVNGFEHRQVAKNSTRVVMGHDAEFARRSKSINSGGSIEVAAGDHQSVAGIPGNRFTGTAPFKVDHNGLILDDQSLRQSRPGSLILSSLADTSISAGQDISVTSDEVMSMSAGRSMSITSGGNMKTVAQNDIQVASGERVVVGAGQAIVLKCGASSLTLNASGEIELTGASIKLRAGKIWLN